MGKYKKRFNVKGRNPVEVKISKVETPEVAEQVGTYDESNPLILPSTKRKTMKIVKDPVGRILTKKQRKKLELVVDRRKKKEERAALLAELESIHFPENSTTDACSQSQPSDNYETKSKAKKRKNKIKQSS